MTITVGSRGRIVLPKALRESLGWYGPQRLLLELDEKTGVLTIGRWSAESEVAAVTFAKQD